MDRFRPAQYARPATRYATDLTDAEFALVEPRLPRRAGSAGRASRPAGGAGRDLLPAAHRLPVAPAAQGLPAQEHGVRLLPPLVAGRHPARPLHALLVLAARSRPAARPSRPPASSTASRSRPPRAAAREATTPARRSTAASGTSWSTRWACCCASSSIRPTSRTATGWRCCCRRLRRRFPWLRADVRRRRLPGRDRRHRGGAGAARAHDRQARDRRPRLRRPAATMGGGANLRLVRPQPAARQGRRDACSRAAPPALSRGHPPAHPQAPNTLIVNPHSRTGSKACTIRHLLVNARGTAKDQNGPLFATT